MPGVLQFMGQKELDMTEQLNCTELKIVEWKELHSSFPLRTPKLQLVAEQPSIGEFWIPPKKHILYPRAK